MAIARYSALEIAAQQIETALRLLKQGDLFSVITLAGAAEQILGELLPGRGRPPFSLRSLYRILRPGKREREEYYPASVGEGDGFIHMDARREALFLLGKAVEEYRKVSGGVTPAMQQLLTGVNLKEKED
jgi:hypothetical protein